LAAVTCDIILSKIQNFGIVPASKRKFNHGFNIDEQFIPKMQIQIHTVSGRKHTLDVEGNWTVGQLKEELQ
jgi:hypothetical protein